MCSVLALAYQPVKQPSGQKRSGGKAPASYFPQQTLGHVFHSSQHDSRSEPATTIEARIISPTWTPGGIIDHLQGHGSQKPSQGQIVSQGHGQSQDRANISSVISSLDAKSYPQNSQNVPKTQQTQPKSSQSQNMVSDVADVSHDLQTLSIDSRSHDSLQDIGALQSVVPSNSGSFSSSGVQGTNDHRTSVYGYQSSDSGPGSQLYVPGRQIEYQQHDNRRPNSTYGVGQEGLSILF